MTSHPNAPASSQEDQSKKGAAVDISGYNDSRHLECLEETITPFYLVHIVSPKAWTETMVLIADRLAVGMT